MNASDLRLGGRWLIARLKLTLRNPRAVVFTLAFPLLLIVLFSGLNGNATVSAMGGAGKVKFAQFYTPSIAMFSLVAAAAVGIAAIVILFAVAVPAFGVHIFANTLPAAIVTLLLGAACLCALGVAVASLVRNADQAMPVAQLTFLPISFISGIWFPLDGAPDWLLKIAHFFPLYHLVNSFDGCFVPGVENNGWKPGDLLALAIWTAVGLFVAARRFRFEPGAEGESRGLLARFAN